MGLNFAELRAVGSTAVLGGDTDEMCAHSNGAGSASASPTGPRRRPTPRWWRRSSRGWAAV